MIRKGGLVRYIGNEEAEKIARRKKVEWYPLRHDDKCVGVITDVVGKKYIVRSCCVQFGSAKFAHEKITFEGFELEKL